MKVSLASPFGVYAGDEFPFPSIILKDDDGTAIDPSALTVELRRWRSTGEESVMPGTVNGSVIEFHWLTGDTDASAVWMTMVRVDDGSTPFSLSGPYLSVYDPQAMWCSVQDVLLIVGDGYSEWEILAAISAAESVVRAWVSRPVGSPVPTRVRRATAILAARALTSDSDDGAAVLEERIADYSVRYADPQSGSLWIVDGEVAELLLPWKPRAYMTTIGEPRMGVVDETSEGL